MRGGRAVLANDPHLRLQIPGVWYLFEAAAPGLHIAGGSLAGTPGVILGHNAAIAWGVTGPVLRASGAPIAGLYAAGRTALGVCSNIYVSGLSVSDCVFSGRRAARSAASPVGRDALPHPTTRAPIVKGQQDLLF